MSTGENLFCERCGVGPVKKCSWTATSHMAPSITVHLCEECEEVARGIIATILPKGPTHSADNNANICEHCGKECLEEEELHAMAWFVGEQQPENLVCTALLCSHSATLVQCVISLFAGLGLRKKDSLSVLLLRHEGCSHFPANG